MLYGKKAKNPEIGKSQSTEKPFKSETHNVNSYHHQKTVTNPPIWCGSSFLAAKTGKTFNH